MASSPTATAGKTITIEVFRYLPEQESEPRYDTFEVPYNRDMVVLDALNHIKDNDDGSLSYRFSCRMAVCGSCGMMVNGEPKLTCKAFLRDYYPNPVRVEPLTHFPVVRDLVINMDDFMGKMEKLKTWIIPKEPRTIEEGTRITVRPYAWGNRLRLHIEIEIAGLQEEVEERALNDAVPSYRTSVAITRVGGSVELGDAHQPATLVVCRIPHPTASSTEALTELVIAVDVRALR